MECPECEGEGTVEFATDFHHYGDEDCKSCKGVGQLSHNEFETFKKAHGYRGNGYECGCRACNHTGVVWVDKGIHVDEVKINVKFIHMVNELAGDIGVFGPWDPVRFRFSGGEGLIMPMMPDR